MLQFGCVPSIWTSLETDWSVRPQKFVVKRYIILSEETEGSWTRLLTSPHCRLCDFSSASMTDSCIVKTLERALWSTRELLLKSVELSWVEFSQSSKRYFITVTKYLWTSNCQIRHRHFGDSKVENFLWTNTGEKSSLSLHSQNELRNQQRLHFIVPIE